MKPMKAVQNFMEKKKINTDLATRIAYRAAHGPETLMHEDLGQFTPAIVVRLKSTEDVVETVRLATMKMRFP